MKTGGQASSKVAVYQRRTLDKKLREIEQMCRGVGFSPLGVYVSNWMWSEIQNAEVATKVDRNGCHVFLKPQTLEVIQNYARNVFKTISDDLSSCLSSVGDVILDYLDYTSIRCKKCRQRRFNQPWLGCAQCDRPLKIHKACEVVRPGNDFNRERCHSCVLVSRPCVKCHSYIKRSEWATCECTRLDHNHCPGDESEALTNCSICNRLVHVACSIIYPPSVEGVCHMCFENFFHACTKCNGIFLKSDGDVALCTICNTMFHIECEVHDECISCFD
jgi:hypothetical protein